ncbi:toll/interleukin-1 receptor domain-containing protein [Frankia sp. AiPa1]|nr:toll/interleukin-1 receptor domain-containing protein [Frankia sp. AiPa1]
MSEQLSDREVLELARAFHRPSEVTSLLERAGLERLEHPSWSGQSSLSYWREINRQLAFGLLPDGRRRILAMASQDFRANPVFSAGLKEITRARAAASGGPAHQSHIGDGERDRHEENSRDGGGSTTEAAGQGGRGDAYGHEADAHDGKEGRAPVPGTTLLAVDPVLHDSDGTLVPVRWQVNLADVVEVAARRCGLPAGAISHRQRGSRLFGTVLDSAAAPVIVGDFAAELAGTLRAYNSRRAGEERVRLRLALLADADGSLDQTAVVTTHRLMDAPGLNWLMRSEPTADLVEILSCTLFDATVRRRLHGLDPTEFREIDVDIPPGIRSAWLTAPGPRPGAEDPAVHGLAPHDDAPHDDAPDGPGGASSAGRNQWDYLISVADADAAWGAWIAWELEARDFQVHLQEWDVVAGQNSVVQLDQAIRHAKKTLLVLSENYLREPKVQAQWTAAWKKDPMGMERRLVPVRISSCRPEGVLHGISYIDLAGLDDADARDAFRRGIDAMISGRNRPTSAPPFPGRRPQP